MTSKVEKPLKELSDHELVILRSTDAKELLDDDNQIQDELFPGLTVRQISDAEVKIKIAEDYSEIPVYKFPPKKMILTTDQEKVLLLAEKYDRAIKYGGCGKYSPARPGTQENIKRVKSIKRKPFDSSKILKELFLEAF